MDSFISLIASAFLLGAVSGLSPGPLLTLVISESLQRGFRSGAAVSIAPLVTDAPIILAMTALADVLSSTGRIIGCLYLLGACYLLYLSIELFRIKGKTAETTAGVRASFMKGAVVNLLNPAPYVFWLTIGAPLLIKAKSISWAAVGIFLAVFYGMLVGLKLLLAVLTGKNRHLMAGRLYTGVMKVLGLLLLLFAVIFAVNGIEKLC